MSGDSSPTSDQMRNAFEAYWFETNKEIGKNERDKWMARSDMWGEPGYTQPTVHFDWLAFKAGAEWQRINR